MPVTTSPDLPRRKASRGFALMPLADVMFQLLIYLMLSTGLASYSLLTLQTGQAGTGGAVGGGNAAEQIAAPTPSDGALWRVEAEAVIVGGQRFDMGELDALTTAFADDDGPAQVILVVGASARVQDISTVLAQLKLSNVGSVRLSTGGG